MDKIRLGRTNLKVTRLGWGSIPIQRVSEEEAVAVVKAVVEMGVDFLIRREDTPPARRASGWP